MPDNISKLYGALKDTYELGSEADFRKYLSDGKKREALRKELEAEYEVGDSASFTKYLGLDNKPQPVQQPQATQPAPAKPTPQKPANATQVVQKPNPVQIPQGFGELDMNYANQVALGKGPVAWNQPGVVNPQTGKTEPKQEKNPVRQIRQAVSGDKKAAKESGLDTAVQRMQEEREYAEATGKPLRNIVNTPVTAPTAVRSEDGQMLMGQTTDEQRVAQYQQQEKEVARKKIVNPLVDDIQKQLEGKVPLYTSPINMSSGPQWYAMMNQTEQLRRMNEADSPEKLWDSLNEYFGLDKKEGDDFTSKFLVENQDAIQQAAARLGMNTDDFVWKELIPNMSETIAERFNQNMGEKYSVKNTADYIAKRMINSSVGALARMGTMTPQQSQFMQEGIEKSNQGDGQHFNAEWYHKLGGEVAQFLPDAPLMMIGGAAGGAAAKTLGAAIKTLGAESLGTLVATGSPFLAANVGKLTKWSGLLGHAITSGAANMGTFMGMSSALQAMASTPVDDGYLSSIGMAGWEGMKEGAKIGTALGVLGTASGAGRELWKTAAGRAAWAGGTFLAENQIFALSDYLADPEKFNWVDSSLDALYMQMAGKVQGMTSHGTDGIKNSWKHIFDPMPKMPTLTDAEKDTVRKAFGGMSFDEIAGDMSNLEKILSDKQNIPLTIRQKISGRTLGVFEPNRPFTYKTNIRGHEIYERAKDGELLNIHTFETPEERDAILQDIADRKQHDQMVHDFISLDMQEKSAPILDGFAQEFGITRQDVWDMMQKKPVELKGDEIDLMDELSRRLHEAATPKGEIHTEQSNTDGAELAGNDGMVNPDVAAQLAQELDEAQNAYLSAPRSQEVQDAINRMGYDARLDDIYINVRENFSGPEVDNFLAKLADYANAKSKSDGYISKTGENIEETVQQEIDRNSFHGTLDEAPDTENIIFIDYNGHRYTVLNGNIGSRMDVRTDPTNGLQVGGDRMVDPDRSGGLIIASDENGNWASLKPDANMVISQLLPKEEFANARREELGVQDTQTLVETGLVKPEGEPEPIEEGRVEVVDNGGNEENAGGEAGVEGDTGANEPSATAISKIPTLKNGDGQNILDEEGDPMYQWEQAPLEDTLSALGEINHGNVQRVSDAVDAMIGAAEKFVKDTEKLTPKSSDPIKRAKEQDQIDAQKQVAQQKLDYWNQAKQELEKVNKPETELNVGPAENNQPENVVPLQPKAATKSGESASERRVRMFNEAKEEYGEHFNGSDQPDDIYELAAMGLGYGTINWEGKGGLQEHLGKDKKRGIGKKYDSNTFNHYLAPKGEGKSLDQIAHEIAESDMNPMVGDRRKFEADEIRDAILELIRGAEKPTDIMDYVYNRRLEAAKRSLESARQDEAERIEAGEKPIVLTDEEIERISKELPFEMSTDEDIPDAPITKLKKEAKALMEEEGTPNIEVVDAERMSRESLRKLAEAYYDGAFIGDEEVDAVRDFFIKEGVFYNEETGKITVYSGELTPEQLRERVQIIKDYINDRSNTERRNEEESLLVEGSNDQGDNRPSEPAGNDRKGQGRPESESSERDEYLKPRNEKEQKIVSDVEAKLAEEIKAAEEDVRKAKSAYEKARTKESDKATDMFSDDKAFEKPDQLFSFDEMGGTDRSQEGVNRRTEEVRERLIDAQAKLDKLQSKSEHDSRIRGALDNERRQTSIEDTEKEIKDRHKQEYEKYIKPLLNKSDEELRQMAKKKEDEVNGDLNQLVGDLEYSAIHNVLMQREYDRLRKDVKLFIENTIDDNDVTFVDKLSLMEFDKLHRLIDEEGVDDPGGKIESYVKSLRKNYPVDGQASNNKAKVEKSNGDKSIVYTTKQGNKAFEVSDYNKNNLLLEYENLITTKEETQESSARLMEKLNQLGQWGEHRKNPRTGEKNVYGWLIPKDKAEELDHVLKEYLDKLPGKAEAKPQQAEKKEFVPSEKTKELDQKAQVETDKLYDLEQQRDKLIEEREQLESSLKGKRGAKREEIEKNIKEVRKKIHELNDKIDEQDDKTNDAVEEFNDSQRKELLEHFGKMSDQELLKLAKEKEDAAGSDDDALYGDPEYEALIDIMDERDLELKSLASNPIDAIEKASTEFKEERKQEQKELGITTDETPEQKADRERADKLADTPLTDAEVDSSSASDVQKTLAKAYLNGNHGLLQEAAYLNVYNDVRNRRQDNEGDRSDADRTQLASPDGIEERGSGQPGEPIGDMASERDVPRQDVAGSQAEGVQRPSDSENDVRISSGERGDSGISESEPKVDGLSSGSRQPVRGSGTGSERRDVRTSGADQRGSGVVGQTGERKDEARSRNNQKPAAGSDAAIAASKQRLAELRKKFKDAGRNGTLSVSLAGMNSEQIGVLGEIITESANLGYQYIRKGMRDFNEWRKQMLSDFKDWLQEDFKWTDAEVEEYLRDVWNCEYNIDGVTRTIGEWASFIGEQELKKVVKADIGSKFEQQKAAESVETNVGDIDNIRESLPFLLPEQQDDVYKAETQFFSEEHQDRAHGNGKGMMFTNGTGTGKTYTGLGIVKRFVKQGKGRVLILTPSQEKVSDWRKDGLNLGLDIESLDEEAKIKGTSATKAKGKGVVVTTYANARQNLAMLEDCFDLIVYDESHKIMESKEATNTTMMDFHEMLTNKNVERSMDRQTYWLPEWVEHRNLLKERVENRERLDALNNYGDNETVKVDGKDVVVAELKANLNARMRDIETRLEELRPIMQEIRESKRPQAEIDSKRTKTVFLSATPFNVRESLRYAEGYLFSFPEEDRNTIGSYNHRSPEDAFLEQMFPAGYRWRYGRLESHVSNAEALGRQEIDFSDYLQNTLQTMSGRMISSDYDYSRDFPVMTLDHAGRFNQAMSEVYRNRRYQPLAEAFRKSFDYNYSTALFEAMKTSLVNERIKEHLNRGQKVVVFHRRRTSGDLEPPFRRALEAARVQASMEQDGNTKSKILTAIKAFEEDFADMLEWEKTIDYTLPREQIEKRFGKDKVAFFSGAETKKTKHQSVEDFMKDNGGKDIIVIQEASGKEGISLHDQTGEHQRVEINLALPQSPIAFIQIEGRIYRIGQKSNAIFEYPLLGLDLETNLFAQKFNGALGTTENLALGSKARNLRKSIANSVLENTGEVDYDRQGLGGKDMDGRVNEAGDKDGFDISIQDYYGNQKMQRGRDNREGVDYFPTPEPVGYKMVEWGQMMDGETALEPSAGHGAIARYVPETNGMTAIEPSASLFTKLQMRAGGPGRRFEEMTFEDYPLANKHDVILMNPPYGVGGKTAMEHVAKAFRHLNEGGRIVAIIPDGPAMEKRVDAWLNSAGPDGLNGSAVVVGEVKLPDSAFGRSGTNVRTRVLVIDKVTRAEMREKVPQKVSVDLSNEHDVNDLFEAIRNVRMPERTIDQVAINEKRAKRTERQFNDNPFVSNVYIGKLSYTDKNVLKVSTRAGGSNLDIDLDLANVSEDYILDKYENLKAGRDNPENIDYGRWSRKSFGSGKNKVPALDAIRDYCDTAIKTLENISRMTADQMERMSKERKEAAERRRIEQQAEAERLREERKIQLEEKLNPIIETALAENTDNPSLTPTGIEYNLKIAHGNIYLMAEKSKRILESAGIDWQTGHKINKNEPVNARTATVVPQQPTQRKADYEYKLDKNTRTGEDMHLVNYGGARLSDTDYRAIERKAKASGGYYNRFKKAWHFKTEEDARKFMESVNASEGNDGSPTTRFRLREKEAPKKTQKVYKLMRLGDDGKLYPLFIDAAAPTELGKWYDADSPDLSILQKMPAGTFLVDYKNGTYTSMEDYAKEHGMKMGKYPSREAVNDATSNGLRWVRIEDTARGQRRYGGESRKYMNLGINGSGTVSEFAMRPGWHAGSLPSMRQIGKGKDRNLRDDRFVWVEGEVPADREWQSVADQNPDKDIPTQIPEDGFYMKATNANKSASQADRIGWYVAGAFKANRIMSDVEARNVITKWNKEHPDQPVEYDFDRESGKDFNAETMQLEDRPTTRFRSREADEDGRFDFDKPIRLKEKGISKDLKDIEANKWNLPENVRDIVAEKLEKYMSDKDGDIQDIDVKPYFGEKGETTAKDALEYISSNSTDEGIKKLASYLLKNIGDNGDVTVKFSENRTGSRGKYYSNNHSVSIRRAAARGADEATAKNNLEQTVIHEIAHAITVRAIENSPEVRKEFLQIYKDYEELREQYGINTGYAAKNPKEFVAEFLGRKAFREALMEIPSNEKGKTFGQKVLDFIKKHILRIKETDTFFKQADDAIKKVMDMANKGDYPYGDEVAEDGIWIDDKDEYAKISHQIATYPKKAERGHVFTDNNYYLCTDIDKDGNFTVLATLPIVGNEEYINELRGKHQRQGFIPIGDRERIGRLVDNVRSRGGRISGNDADAEAVRFRTGGDASLSMGQSSQSSADIQQVDFNRKEEAGRKLAKKLNSDFEAVTELDQIQNKEVRDAIAAGHEVPGWIEIGKDGKKKIFMYLPHVRDTYDAEKTIAHEVIGHQGMRELLGEKGYKSYCRALLYDLKDPELQKYWMENLAKNGFDTYRTIDEFLAEAAEKGYGDLGMWQKVKNAMTDALRSAGFTMSPSISDVKYMVWLSKHNLEKGNVMNRIEREALLYRLGKERYEVKVRNGEFTEEQKALEGGNDVPYFPGDGKTLFRHTPSVKNQRLNYERALKRAGYVWKEAHIDAMQSAIELMRAISGHKKIEEIPSAENFVLLENQMSSKEEQMDFLFNRDYMKPLDDAVSRCLPDMGKGIDEQLKNLQLYMIKKHGLERNRVLYVRDAIRDLRKDSSADQQQVDDMEQDYNDTMRNLRDDLRNGTIDLKEYFEEVDKWISNNIPEYKAGEKDYSGLTDLYGKGYNEADIIDEVMSTEAMLGDERVNNLWEKTNAVSKFGLDMEYEGGLDSKEKHDKVSDMFEWYVPLRGYDEKTAEEVYDYLEEHGNDRKWAGPVLMNAKGRESLADVDVFATLGAMSSSAINRSLHNQMKQAFARFVRNHYKDVDATERLVTELPHVWAEKQHDPITGAEVWVEKFPDIPENAKADDVAAILDQYQQDMKAKEATGDAKRVRQNSNIPFRPADKEHKAQHIVDVWINGEKHSFVVNGNPRAAQAINGQLKAERNSNILWLSSLSHFMAKMNTSYSPDFIMRNTERDLIYSAANIAVKENFEYWLRWAKNYGVATGRVAAGVPAMHTNLFKRYREGNLNMGNATDRYFKEFMENGGETGWVERKNLDKWKKAIKQGVKKDSTPEKVGKAVINALPDAIEAMNERAENMARFATYMTSREMGRTITRSVSDAKEVSVNFNRKGAGRKTVGLNKGDNSWLSSANAYLAGWSAQNLQDYIMFYNAGVQGMTNMIKNVANHPIKGSTAFAAFALAGMLMPQLNQFLFNEDDDKTGKEPENPYAELPEYVRRNNLCIYSDKGNFITIALPIELRAMYGIGDMAASYINHPELRSTKNMGEDIITQLSQIAPLDFFGEGAGPMWAAVPSGIRPFAEAAANKNWLGQPIERDEERWNENKPRWTRAFKNVGDAYVGASKKLNAATNPYNDENIKGWADGALTDPALVEHIVNGYFGGVGSTINRVSQLAKHADEMSPSEAITSNWMPIIRTQHYSPNERTRYARTRNKWWYYKEEADKTQETIKVLKKRGEHDPISYMRSVSEEEGKKGDRAKIMDKAYKEYSKIKKKMEKTDDLQQKDLYQLQMDQIMEGAVKELDKIQ